MGPGAVVQNQKIGVTAATRPLGSTYFALVTARVAPAERLDAPLRNEFGASSADAVTAPFTP